MLSYHLLCLILALGVSAKDYVDTFDEKPDTDIKSEAIDVVRFYVEEDVEPETTLKQKSTNQTEEEIRDEFDDSEVIDEFNERYLHRMLARTAAIALASPKQAECKDKDKNCGSWALQGYCFSNAGYMSVACSRSCDVCNLDRCIDNHPRCQEWSADGECDSNPDYMHVACSQSCGLCPPKSPEKDDGCEEEGINLQGRTGSNVIKGIASWPACSQHCQDKPGCKAWVWAHIGAGKYAGNCALVEGYTNKVPDVNTISGTKDCTGPVESFESIPNPPTKDTWEVTEGLDCYEGFGGVSLQPDPYSRELTLSDCQSACQKESNCVAIIRDSNDGDNSGLCYLRQTIEKQKCAKDSKWNLYSLKRGQEGSTTSKPTVDKKNKWKTSEGLDCYEGVGGVAIQPDPYSKDITLADCQSTCLNEPSCVAIIRDSNDGSGSGICYLRKEIDKGSCAKDPQWNLHELSRGQETSTTTKPSKEWTVHSGLDCYQDQGGDPISPDPLPNKVNLAECKEACLSDSSCEGIVRDSTDNDGPGLCYLRTNVMVSQCEQGTKWQLHTNSRLGEEEETTTGGGDCQDYHKYCDSWASNGECSKSQYYMNIYCKKACGICSGGDGGGTDIPDTITPSGCKDTRTDCLQLAKAGHCYARPGQTNKVRTMEYSCRRSCGFCGSIPDHILDQQSCATVTSIPRHVIQKYSLDSRFYGKFTQAYGMPITASKSVDDRALMRFCYIVRWVYSSHKSARRAAHSNFGRFIIIGKNQRTTQMPEYRHMDPYYDERSRGFGAHVTSTSEENLLYLQKNKWRGMDMAGHEGAHNLHLTGLERGKPSIYRAISQAFTSAMAAGKYYSGGRGLYARTDYREYYAEAFCSYIGDTWSTVPPHSANELYRYDRAVYSTLTQALPCNKITSWIYVQNDLDQVLSRTQRLNINYPACTPEPAVNIPKESDITLPQSSSYTYTSTRERCKFPFSFGGRSYTSCTNAYHSNNYYRASWCATATYSNGAWYDSATPSHMNSWGYCGSDPTVKAQGCSRTNSGKTCIFPFRYLGIQHNSCQGIGWCATSVDNQRNMKTWSKCDSSCFSRLENEAISTGYNSLS